MRIISGGPCTQGDTCPTVYDDGDRYLVQGVQIEADTVGVKLGDGEGVLSVPKALLDALRK